MKILRGGERYVQVVIDGTYVWKTDFCIGCLCYVIELYITLDVYIGNG